MAGDKEHPTVAAVSARRGYAISRIEAPPTAVTNPQLHSGAVPQTNGGGGGSSGGGGGSGYNLASGDCSPKLKGGSGRGGDGGGKGGGRGRRKQETKGGSASSAAPNSGAITTKADDPSGGSEGCLDRKAGSSRPALAPPNRQRSPRAHHHASRDGGGFGGGRNSNTNRGGRQYHHEHDDRTELPPPAAAPSAAAATARAGAAAGRNADRQHQRTNSNSESTAHTSHPRADTLNKPYSVRGRGGDNSSGSNGSGSIFSRLGPPPGSPRNVLMRAGGGGGGGSHDDRRTNPYPNPKSNIRGRRGTCSSTHEQRPQQSTCGVSSSRVGHTDHGHGHADGHKPMPTPHPHHARPEADAGAPVAAASTAAAGVAAGAVAGVTACGNVTATARVADVKGRSLQHGKHVKASRSVAKGSSVGEHCRVSVFNSNNNFGVSHSRREGAGHESGHGDRSVNDRDVNSRGDLGRKPGKTSRLSEASGARDNAAGDGGISKARGSSQHQRQQKQGGRPQHQHREHRHDREKYHGEGSYARGTCMSMCPESEIREREAEGGLSCFETTEATAKPSVPFRKRIADPDRMVKKYRRSAAGRDMHSPQQLRPLAVLQTTARYLVKDVFAKACSNSGSDSESEQRQRSPGPSSIAKAYVFVEDRLRAVRQDLTVQGLVLEASAGAAEVLKTTANFYIVAGYLMSDEASDVFDRHLHTRELQGVFSSLAELFFQAKAKGASFPDEPSGIDETFHALGADEYLCMQAVHALATAIANTPKGAETQLGVTVGGQGVGRLVTTTVSKLCSTSGTSGTGRASGSKDGENGGMVSASAAAAAATTTGARAANGPMSEPLCNTFPKMAIAVRLLGVVGAGDWSQFFRVLGIDVDVDGCSGGTQSDLRLVGGELASSPFVARLRCLCHGMLLPVRVHALRAMNMAYGRSEKVPLADVARMLRTRDEDHAAGICRALSLPIHEAEGEGGQEAGGVVRSVVFKSVPAVWKSEKPMVEGPCSGDDAVPRKASLFGSSASARSGAPQKGTPTSFSIASAREDDLVGLARALAVAIPDTKDDKGKEDSPATVTCDDCAGFGCSRCDNGKVRVEEVVGRRREEGLWEAALCPT